MNWSPDTCKCKFGNVDWQTNTATVAQKCNAHQSVTNEDLFVLVRNENMLKNQAQHAIIIEVPSLAGVTTQWDEEQQMDVEVPDLYTFREGVEYLWSFDESRTLVVDITNSGATAQEISDVLALDLTGVSIT